MIFGEYIEHDPAMPFQIFRRMGQQDWVGEGDVMVANLGRTMRLSGEPFYMCWWQIEEQVAKDHSQSWKLAAWEDWRRRDADVLASNTPRLKRFTKSRRANHKSATVSLTRLSTHERWLVKGR